MRVVQCFKIETFDSETHPEIEEQTILTQKGV